MSLRVGIYVDLENLMKSGGWSLRHDALIQFAEMTGDSVVRAHTYLSYDPEKMANDSEYSEKTNQFHTAVRSAGFQVELEPLKVYKRADGSEVVRGDMDVDMAVDAMLHSQSLDRVILVTGDGHFAKVTRALQSLGKKVDVVGCNYVSKKLKLAADRFVNGYLIENLIYAPRGRVRGYLRSFFPDKYYGFLSLYLEDMSEGREIFVHGTKIEDGAFSGKDLLGYRGTQYAWEYSLAENDEGKIKAMDVVLMRSVGRRMYPSENS